MNDKILEKMTIIWAKPDSVNVESKLQAFSEIKEMVTKNDLPFMIDLLKSDKNDFWTRELLGEIIIDHEGVDYLDDLFEAYDQNKKEGYDNDTFSTDLADLAELRPNECSSKIKELLSGKDYLHKDTAEWLLQFCK